MVAGDEARRGHAPARGGGGHQHRARARPGHAHRHPEVAHAARAVRVLVAVAHVAVALHDPHAAPVGAQLLGEHHRQRAADALAHLRAAAHDGDDAVGGDVHEDAGDRLRVGLLPGRGHEAHAEREAADGAAERGHERPARDLDAAHCFASVGDLADGGADARVGPAAAEVAAHRLVDVLVAGRRVRGQQRGRAHDLARLAEPALRHRQLDPGLLQRVIAVRGQALDGGDRLARRAGQRHHAGPHRLAVEVHGAGAAERLAAAVLGAGEAEEIAQRPQERHLGIGVEAVLGAVDAQRDHRVASVAGGQAAPVSIQARIRSPNCFCVPGAGVRPWPGFQPQATSSSWALCSQICSSVLPPLRAGSLICAQICPGVRPSQAISSGARCHFGAPGTRACSRLRSWWQDAQCIAGTPSSIGPRTAGGIVHQVPIALPRPVVGRMAVDAARMEQHLARLREERERPLVPVGDGGEGAAGPQRLAGRLDGEEGGEGVQRPGIGHRVASVPAYRRLS